MKQIRILLLLAATLIAATTALCLVEVKSNDTDLTKAGTVFRDCPDCPEMAMLPQGRFVMGVPPGEEERENVMDYFRGHSVPQHLVTIRFVNHIRKRTFPLVHWYDCTDFYCEGLRVRAP